LALAFRGNVCPADKSDVGKSWTIAAIFTGETGHLSWIQILKVHPESIIEIMMAGKIYIGTSGWSYKHWKGNFYPPDKNYPSSVYNSNRMCQYKFFQPP